MFMCACVRVYVCSAYMREYVGVHVYFDHMSVIFMFIRKSLPTTFLKRVA